MTSRGDGGTPRREPGRDHRRMSHSAFRSAAGSLLRRALLVRIIRLARARLGSAFHSGLICDMSARERRAGRGTNIFDPQP
jgi:hypothetical protein